MLLQRAVHNLVIQTILEVAPHPPVNHKAVEVRTSLTAAPAI